MPLLTDGRATGRGAGEEEEVSRRFRVTASDGGYSQWGRESFSGHASHVEELASENDSRPLAIS